MKDFFVWVVALVFIFSLIFTVVTDKHTIHYIKLGGATVKVDLALTPAAQAQGLSGRTSLASDRGMLFVFNPPSVAAFWMKDMNFPIDMIWIDENMKVIYIAKSAIPESFPETFGPNKNAKYVLEVVSGFSDKNNLKVGDSVSVF